MLHKSKSLFLVLSVFYASCGNNHFSGSAETVQIPTKSAGSPDSITGNSLPNESSDATKPSNEPAKPVATETFNECDKFSDTNMVAFVSEIQDKKNPNGETIQSLRQFPFDLENYYLSKPAVTSTVCMKNLDIGLTAFSKGFPGAASLQEWFALDINFILVAPESGDYYFTMNSDDGSAINIAGKQLEFQLGNEKPRKFLWGMDGHSRPENFGRQASVADGSSVTVPAVPTEKITLAKGQKYPMRVLYYQGPRFEIMLDMMWKTPSGNAPERIPLSAIQKPKAELLSLIQGS